jgi:DNA-binding response OmpR family regulator
MESIVPKIMVVDDDEDFTTLYKEYLKMVGFDAVAETQSSKAMDLAYSEKPDLFVLDLMMPEPNGFQLCRMLRADPNFKRTPIIIVTALTDLDSKMVAMGAGASDYLTKPFHIDELKSRINVLLERVNKQVAR